MGKGERQIPLRMIAPLRALRSSPPSRTGDGRPDWHFDAMSPSYIVGPRATLRHVSLGFSREEVARQFQWGRDDELQYWSGSVPSAPTIEQFEADVATWARQRDPRRDRFAILNEHDSLIGMISYYNLMIERGQAELGIYIGERAYWSHGYGTEAILALLGHLFRNTSFRAMHLSTYASNARAQACYRKCGFDVTGSMRKYSSRAGYYTDVQMVCMRERFLALHGDRPLTVYGRQRLQQP